jgi:hypothetical protein
LLVALSGIDIRPAVAGRGAAKKSKSHTGAPLRHPAM